MQLHILYKYMNQSSKQEANSCSASQQFPHALWILKVQSVQKGSPLAHILLKIKPVSQSSQSSLRSN
jgi:hypothetical protein